MAIKNEVAYIVVEKVKELQNNHKLAHDTVILMIGQEFSPTRYRLNTLRASPKVQYCQCNWYML